MVKVETHYHCWLRRSGLLALEGSSLLNTKVRIAAADERLPRLLAEVRLTFASYGPGLHS